MTINKYHQADAKFAESMRMKRQFVEDLDGFRRKFVFVTINNQKIYIGHTLNNKLIEIEESFLDQAIQYFDRI